MEPWKAAQEGQLGDDFSMFIMPIPQQHQNMHVLVCVFKQTVEQYTALTALGYVLVVFWNL